MISKKRIKSHGLYFLIIGHQLIVIIFHRLGVSFAELTIEKAGWNPSTRKSASADWTPS
jgi:hypothetical protein